MLALNSVGKTDAAREMAERLALQRPTALVPRALLGLRDEESLVKFAKQARESAGEDDFELLETGLVFAQLGLVDQAYRIVLAGCVDAVPPAQRTCLPLYYLAWYASLQGDNAREQRWLAQAASTKSDREFASRPEELEILQHAVAQNPQDAQAHLQLGCLLAGLGRIDEANAAWQQATQLNPRLSVAWRSLGLVAAAGKDLARAETMYRQAIAARPDDQTLYRDLAEILLAADGRAEAIRLLESMPVQGVRRAEITVMLADAYLQEKRYEDCIRLLETTPYFVNWEGQDVIWRLFNQSHLQRGQERLDRGDAASALADFESALTYPENLNVGRSNKPEEAPAQYWRGKALAALGKLEPARAAWQAGAEGADVEGIQNEFRQKCREALAESVSH